MKKYVLAIDQGTTGTTVALVDTESGKLLGSCNQEFKQYYPNSGWVEHDLSEIWNTIELLVPKVLKQYQVPANEIEAIGITNQRETTCAYTKNGIPLARAIVWQDRRTQNFCQQYQSEWRPYQKMTGLPLDPYFSATKMNWLINNSPEVNSAFKQNNLKLSTIDSFLLYKLTNFKSFKTEASNASRSLLMDLKTCQWNSQLLNFFQIPKVCLPEICDSFGNFGQTQNLGFLPDGIPIGCILGDQQAALFGQACFEQGDIKCTYGTGAFILTNTGSDIIYSQNGLLTTVAYRHQGITCYAIEGSCYIAGAAVQWLRDNLKFFENSSEIENYANQITNLNEMEHIHFFPFFTGIGSPYWISEARGAIIGLTRDTNQKHIARACLEGIAQSISDTIEAFDQDSHFPINEIKVDGGACSNNLLMQMQANFSHKTITRPRFIETTSYGVALGAMLINDSWDFNRIKKMFALDKKFYFEKIQYYENKRSQWKNLVKKIFP